MLRGLDNAAGKPAGGLVTFPPAVLAAALGVSRQAYTAAGGRALRVKLSQRAAIKLQQALNEQSGGFLGPILSTIGAALRAAAPALLKAGLAIGTQAAGAAAANAVTNAMAAQQSGNGLPRIAAVRPRALPASAHEPSTALPAADLRW